MNRHVSECFGKCPCEKVKMSAFSNLKRGYLISFGNYLLGGKSKLLSYLKSEKKEINVKKIQSKILTYTNKNVKI